MKKFLVLYKAPTSSFEQMKSATPEQQKAGTDAWMSWSKSATSIIADMGGPLGKSLRVTPTGASPTTNDLGGYSILQAESKEALAAKLKGHPHFKTPEGFIEVVELMPNSRRVITRQAIAETSAFRAASLGAERRGGHPASRALGLAKR